MQGSLDAAICFPYSYMAVQVYCQETKVRQNIYVGHFQTARCTFYLPVSCCLKAWNTTFCGLRGSVIVGECGLCTKSEVNRTIPFFMTTKISIFINKNLLSSNFSKRSAKTEEKIAFFYSTLSHQNQNNISLLVLIDSAY